MTDKSPIAAAQRLARTELPRRFYKEATVGSVEGGFAVLLDGRSVRTPSKRPVVVADRPVAEAMAAEWSAQGEVVDPSTMPVTRIVNAAVEHVSGASEAVRDDVAAYAASDLLCYRAGEPRGLVARQDALWSPLVAWAKATHGIRLTLAEGIMPVVQEPSVGPAVRRAIADYDPLRLAALHTAMTLTGSAIIAIALAEGVLTAEAAWEAAHVDEDWQASQWGVDEEAVRQRALRWRDMKAAAAILAAARA